MNILANCRKHFLKDKTITNRSGNSSNNNTVPDPEWTSFLKDWASFLAAQTEAEYTTQLAHFRRHPELAT